MQPTRTAGPSLTAASTGTPSKAEGRPHQHNHINSRSTTVYTENLTTSAAPRGATGDHATAQAHITRALRGAAEHPGRADQGTVRPDRPAARRRTPTRTSSPACPAPERVRAARLLAEIGDCRARFPTPESLACLAGVAPSTRQSGKMRTVGFRWSCDKQLRDAVPTSPATPATPTPGPPTSTTAPAPAATTTPTPCASWPAPGCYVIWHCWQDSIAYDPNHTEHSNASSTKTPSRSLDIGLLAPPRPSARDFRTLAALIESSSLTQ